MNTPSNATSSSLALLADSPPRMMDGAAMDYFLMEMVHTLRDSARVAEARAKKVEQEMIESGLIPAPPPAPPTLKAKKDARESTGSLASQATGAAGKSPADEEEEPVRSRLEAIGLHVGANITERLCHDRPVFTDTLDTIKFICKDLWAACWDKQVDNLRTNHRGVYVLQDNTFKPIARVSSFEGRADATRRAKLYVALPAGIIRGSLSRLGLQGVIIPEVNLPQCTFQVKLPKGT
ncbi:TRAPP complex subunit trs33 [Dentipellis sp. KUC8613]|nr:TRAPP complex subunit trs33 [Dentipellis sp. KUC8613]